MNEINHEEDKELVYKAAQSDKTALGEIVNRHQDSIYRLTYRLVGQTELAQDLTQETFLKAFENLHQMNNGRALRHWLCQIAKNLVKDRWKLQRKEVPFETFKHHIFSPKNSPIQEIEAREMEVHIQSALLKISRIYREAFLLKYVEELSYEELCTILNIGKSAAKLRVYRACRALRDLLPQYENTLNSKN